ncbi:MAG TPA: TetR/AcrR family transcriptional regulator [Bacteroidales bacterium]|jgi:AcrR family transcriptional regulator|nr:TetR/AcrR family transcriptional regulator [Bacteroidales bacterium]HQP24280.1 TetR/AcrR family transcriptional regulator [Smithellaceae bacterium]
MKAKQTVDRRIARTRLAIREALVGLIKEKGFDALTVRDIVLLANINRGTFYLHYKDKFDLLEKTETEILNEIYQIFIKTSSIGFDDDHVTDQLQELIISLLVYVKDHAELMHAILGLQGDYSLVKRFRVMLDQNLKLGVLSGFKEENFLVPKEYLIAYIIQAHLGVLQSWLGSGCQEPPAEIARILFQLSFNGPMRAAGFGLNKSELVPR